VILYLGPLLLAFVLWGTASVRRAPYDLFLSADMAYPRKLAEAGWGLITFPFTQSAVLLFGCGRVPHWMWINLGSRRMRHYREVLTKVQAAFSKVH
jgi:hypothetical protein